MTQQRRHVLVVEDSAELRETVRIVLLDAGYDVQVAEDGEPALKLLEEGPAPDGVLVDVLMPGMDGAEFLARMREQPRLSRVRVCVMTGIATGLVAKLLNADVFLTKPFGDQDLLQAVRELLRGS